MDEPLWTDRHRPDIGEFPQEDVRDRLEMASQSPLNLFIYGPRGSGKTAAARAIANRLHDDPENDVVTINVRDFFDRRKKEIQNDPRFAPFLKGQTEFSKQYRKGTDKRNKYKKDWSVAKMFSHVIEEISAIPPSGSKYKTIILDNAEDLREDLQQSLRRTMERHYESTQFVFTSRSSGTIIGAIKSRCFLVPVPRPTHEGVVSVLRDVAEREGVDATEGALNKIAALADGNIREAVLALQTAAAQSEEVDPDAVDEAVSGVGHQDDAAEIFDEAEQGELWDARKRVDALLDEEGFDGDDVLSLLDTTAHRRYTGETLHQIVEAAAEVDFRMADAANERVQLMWYVSEAADAV